MIRSYETVIQDKWLLMKETEFTVLYNVLQRPKLTMQLAVFTIPVAPSGGLTIASLKLNLDIANASGSPWGITTIH